VKTLAWLLIGGGLAYGCLLFAFLLIFKRGGWELEQYDREDGP
jgi:hypothetical protein